jgi:hypothetical protein
MRPFLAIALSAALLSLLRCGKPHPETTAPIIESAASTITWHTDEHGTYPVTDNSTFLYLDSYRLTRTDTIGLVLRQRIVTVLRSDLECCEAHITVLGTPANGTSWTIQRDARSGEIAEYERFYRTTEGGCCGSNIRYVYFDLLTGRQRFTATRPLADIEVINECCKLDRYFALDRLSEPGDDTFEAKLQYGAESGPIQATYLHCAPSSGIDPFADNDLDFLQNGKVSHSQTQIHNEGPVSHPFELVPQGYPHNSPATEAILNGFAILLTFDGHKKITIPVIDDRIAIEKTALPKGCAFAPSPSKDFVSRS